MLTIDTIRKWAFSFEDVDEKPHFHKVSFRVKEKIFITLDEQKMNVSLKLSPVDQSIYCSIRPAIATPATGAWGKQGWTVMPIQQVPNSIMKEAIKKAYQIVCPVEKLKTKKKISEQIQTLHPDNNKTNKKISLDKYNTIKDHVLKILKKTEPTHSELMELLYQNLKDSFEGGIQWYGETVKLDLEARKIIERTVSKPERYKLSKKKS